MSFASEEFADLLQRLSDATTGLDDSQTWPASQLQWLSDAGVLGWTIPSEFGGSDIGDVELLDGYEQLTSACLTTAFILTQRNAAILRIANSQNSALQRDLLPELCNYSRFATVGISHLTTSRRHWKQPTGVAEPVADGFVFHGEVPWVTGADRADVIVTGGTMSNGEEILVALPTNLRGIEIAPPTRLLALNASRTATVRLSEVSVPADRVLAGPIAQVMRIAGQGGTGSFTTSALALGHARNCAQMVITESEHRAELQEIAAAFVEEIATVRTDLHAAASDLASSHPHLTAEDLRRRANSVAVRAAEACMAISKGSGFTAGHPAERLVREAMFFLVWSCPQPVLLANLRELAGMA